MTHTAGSKFLLAAVAMFLTLTVKAAEPSAAELLAKYDQAMAPRTFEAELQLTAHREDGSTRSYGMRTLKGEGERFRIWFTEPAAVKGQEMLRTGENLWLYLPSLKRATRIANRENFQGGDFNNADILRVDHSSDYEPKIAESDSPDMHVLELKAKSANSAYDTIRLWLRKSDVLPVKGQYFGSSGQVLRTATFSDFKQFDKRYIRPAKVRMQNELVKSRWSELELKAFKLNVQVPAQRFVQADLGK